MTYTLSSPALRGDTYEYDLWSNTSKLIEHLPLPSASGLIEDELDVSMQYVKSEDGQEVPFTTIQKKNIDVSAPVIINSYGCYGVDIPIQLYPFVFVIISNEGGFIRIFRNSVCFSFFF